VTEASIAHLLDLAASRHPDRVAVIDGAGRLSYAALRDRTRAIAAAWRDAGVVRGDRVSLLDHNSWFYVAAYFASAWLGAVLNPINTRLAPHEIEDILGDAEPRVVVASKPFAELARASSGSRRILVAEVLGAASDDPDLAPAEVAAHDLAHLYYTSGTTGRSKGVMLTHDNVLRHAEGAVAALGLGPADRWGHIAPMFHLADAWATFAITMVGGVHVMTPRFDVAPVLELIQRERVTVTNLVPTMLNLLVKHEGRGAYDLTSMRLVLSGGAPIAPEVVAAVLSTFGCEYAQTYGLTETSPYLTLGLLPAHLKRLPAAEQLHYRARTGRPVPTAMAEVEVVDAQGAPVPHDDASVGEIRARGATVSPGYWRRPEETAAAHRGGWFYTGDLAVVDGEGFVNIVDRKKDMILTGGENVYSIEVEHALYAHPAVLEAAVYGVADATWGEVVAAAVVLRPGRSASADELSDFCRERIAGYKLPRLYSWLAELPRTGSGKIAKRLLRDGHAQPS